MDVPVEETNTAVTSSSNDSSSTTSDKRSLRKKTILFVVVFLVSVFGLLAGYESVKNTLANDWYLLQVAESTRFLLDQVGYSCTVGDARRYTGREGQIRTALTKLRQGERVEEQPSTELSPGTPLTTWETWEYESRLFRQASADAQNEVERLTAEGNATEPAQVQKLNAAQKRLSELTLRDRGPLVSFILKAGPERQLTDMRERLRVINTNGELSAEAREKQSAAINERIRALEAEVKVLQETSTVQKQEDASSENPKNPRKDISFNFIVIPDCGAIPSIAIFVAAVLAFPAGWWRRLAGIFTGVLLLYWINAFRLACLGVIGAWDRGGPVFRFAHEYIWQGIYIIFVVAIWIGWVEFLVRRRVAK